MNKQKMNNNLILIFALLAICSVLIISSSKLNIIYESVGQNEGITPIDPENVTDQTLQNYTTDDKDMSIGIEGNMNKNS